MSVNRLPCEASQMQVDASRDGDSGIRAAPQHVCATTLLLCLALLTGKPHRVMAFDVFKIDNAVSDTSAAALVAATTASPCAFGRLGEALRLEEAVNRALCNNPTTRQAWPACVMSP